MNFVIYLLAVVVEVHVFQSKEKLANQIDFRANQFDFRANQFDFKANPIEIMLEANVDYQNEIHYQNHDQWYTISIIR